MSEDIKDMAQARRIITQQRAELTAARVLLREVYEEGNLGMGDEVSLELDNRIRSYLDACDTLGNSNG